MPRMSRRNEDGERLCNRCGEYKPETEEYWYVGRPGQFNTPCRACHLAEVATRSLAKRTVNPEAIDRCLTKLAEGRK